MKWFLEAAPYAAVLTLAIGFCFWVMTKNR
jgi:hypothetical protein